MPSDRRGSHRSPTRRWIAAALLLAFAGGAWWWHGDYPLATGLVGSGGNSAAVVPATTATGPTVTRPLASVASPPPPAPGLSAAPAQPTPTPRTAVVPSFDIVRVSPDGSAVLAGRAAPGSRVEIALDGKLLLHTEADRSGQWVALPDTPLAAGGRQLSVASVTPSAAGAPSSRIEGSAPVLLLAPAQAAISSTSSAPIAASQPAAADGALALLLPQAGMPRLLQAPGPASSGKVGLDVVDYDDHGDIRFAGRAPPHATVRLYIDDHAAGEAAADALGSWLLAPAGEVTPGQHRVRVDQIGGGGRVVARVELPFERATLPPGGLPGQSGAVTAAAAQVVVQPRQNLWRIARAAYGRGVRYTVIYQANREQIRNPDRIYPGQVFAVPTPTPLPAGAQSR